MSANDDLVRPLVAGAIEEPLVAGAFFRAVWLDRRSGGPGLFGLISFVAGVLFGGRVRKPPSTPYIAVGENFVAVLEFGFGPPRLERRVKRWPRVDVLPKIVKGNEYSIELRVLRYTLSLEAVKYDDDSKAVVDALRAS